MSHPPRLVSWQPLGRRAPAGYWLLAAASAAYSTCTSALLFSYFSQSQLALAFVAGGALGYAASQASRYVRGRFSAGQVRAGWQWARLGAIGGLLLLGALAPGRWVYFTLFVVGPSCWATSPADASPELGERSRGLLGLGAAAATLAGCLSVPMLLGLASPAGLLWPAFGGLLAAEGLGYSLHRAAPAAPEAPTAASPPVPATYYALLFALALLPAGTLVLGECLFVGLARGMHPGPVSLAGFLGLFFGGCAAAELVVRGVLLGRPLRRYSLRAGLVALPVLLLAGYALAAFFGTAYGETLVFFALVASSRFLLGALQGSVNEPSYQRLLQPLATGRGPLPGSQSGATRALGYLAASLLLLALAALGRWPLVALSYLLLPLLVGWLYAAGRVYLAYRGVLRQVVAQLAASLPPPAGYGSGTSSSAQPVAAGSHTLEEASRLAGSEAVADRLAAVAVLGQSGRFYAYRHLLALLDDPVAVVREAAIGAAGTLQRPELWPRLLHYLAVPEHQASAQAALVAGGEAVVPTLIKHFTASNLAPALQVRLVGLVAQLGGEAALRFLRAGLTHPSQLVRDQAVAGLAQRHYRATTPERLLLLRQLNERVALLVWLAATRLDLQPHYARESALLQALEQERQRLVPQLFHLLAVAYGDPQYEAMGELLIRKDPATLGLLRELLAVVLPAEVQDIILPLVAAVPLAQKVQLSATRYPQQRLGPEARLHDFINQDYARLSPWVRAVAVRELLVWHHTDPTALLVANAALPEAVLAETALYVLQALNPTRFAALHATWQASPGAPGLTLAGRIAAGLPAASLLVQAASPAELAR